VCEGQDMRVHTPPQVPIVNRDSVCVRGQKERDKEICASTY